MNKKTHNYLKPVAKPFALALALASFASQAASLTEIYQQAASNAPQIRGATAALEAAKQTLPQSQANFLPNVAIGANATVNDSTTITNSQSAFISLRQSIYNIGNNIQRDSAMTTISQAEAQFAGAGQNLILDVANAYFNVLAAEDSLAFAEAEKQSNARQLEQTQQRFEVGLIAITDVHESQAAYDSSVAQAIAAANAVDNSREQLRELTGQFPGSLAKLDETLPLLSPEPSDPARWSELALRNNPALLAAQEATNLARHNVDAQGASEHPTADLVLQHTEVNNGSASTTSGTSAVFSLNYSLYDGKRTKANVSQARQQLRQSEEAYEQIRRATERQVRNAYRGVLSNISQVQALKQAVISNESALRAAEAGYEVGTRTTVDVLVARSNLFNAQRNYAQARYNYVLNTLQLHQAAGTLSELQLEKIDNWLK